MSLICIAQLLLQTTRSIELFGERSCLQRNVKALNLRIFRLEVPCLFRFVTLEDPVIVRPKS